MDFSKSSMSIAQLRTKIRGCLKTVWILDWIENIPRLGLGNFDLAQSGGVLHHLKCPQKGLKIIYDIQCKHGGAQIMVYGKYGRTGVYQIQDVLRIINQYVEEVDRELTNAKLVINGLSDRHWFNQNNLKDHIAMGDVGIYDLCLHSRDISFRIQELYRWVVRSNYILVDFALPEHRIQLSLRSIIHEQLMLAKVTTLNISVMQSVSEIVYGNMFTHEIYVSKQQNSEASLNTNENVIFAYGSPVGFSGIIHERSNYRQKRNETFIFATLVRMNELVGRFTWPSTVFGNFALQLLTTKPFKPRTIQQLVIGCNRATKINMTINDGEDVLKELFSYLKETGVFFLKKNKINEFPKTCCLNQFKLININAILI